MIKLTTPMQMSSDPSSDFMASNNEAEEEAAREAFKKYSVRLKEVVIAAGFKEIVAECERQNLITTHLMNELLDDMSGRTVDDRARKLVDTIRQSLGFTSKAMTDTFLCIIYSKCGPEGQAVASAVARDCE